MLATQFISYFIAYMSCDECHMADGGGYRVFLSQELGFLLPILEEEHYSIYCINFIHDRIDLLDSSPDDHIDYHQVLGDQIIQRLNLFF
uniref:Ubiquitin-like protease family profile domain-containing protein n=1 Tax=Setaria italica TaxID=4555 RepID=K3Z0L8_SETIT